MAREMCSVHQRIIYLLPSYIQLQSLGSLFLTAASHLFPVLIYVAFRSAHPDDVTMKDVKNALNDNDIPFEQLKRWNADRCLE
jgi:hypothetical protein